MKARVNTFLNIRTGTPEILPNNNPNDLFFRPGDEVEITDEKIGDFYKESNVWYKLPNGSFIWSGGVDLDKSMQSNLFFRSKDVNYWTSQFGINKLQMRGMGIKVAILDSGIFSTHKDFEGTKLTWNDFVNGEVNPIDTDGHGTHCSGILVGKGNHKIEGVVPFCELIVGRIIFKHGLPSPIDNHWFINGLRWACENADVISISIGIADKLWNSNIESIIDGAVNEGKIIVCSIGNITDNSLLNHGDYPAKYQNCISVGALNFEFQLSSLTKRFEKTDIHFPGEFITSTSKNGVDRYIEDSGTSMSTPFVAGIIALKKQQDNSFNINKARDFLKNISEKKSTGNFDYWAIKNQILNI